jgi:hypothetical protein
MFFKKWLTLGVPQESRPKFITKVPWTITTPGTYRLACDLYYRRCSASAITVEADGVLIDFNGHRLWNATGASTAAVGVASTNRSHITIQHGTIQGFRFGIQLSGKENCANKVRHMVLAGNWYIGLWVEGEATVVAHNRIENTGGCNIAGYTTPIGIHVAGPNSTVVDNLVKRLVWCPGITREVVGLAIDAAPNTLVARNVFQQEIYTPSSWGVWINSVANDHSTRVAVENNLFSNLQYGAAFIYAQGRMKNNDFLNVPTQCQVAPSNFDADREEDLAFQVRGAEGI